MKRIRLAKQTRSLDRTLLYLTLILTFLGLIAVADASAPQAANFFSDKFYFAKQQVAWALLGLVGLFVASKVHYSFWERIATPLFFLSLVSLILVLVPSVGSRFLGARRWIIAGPLSFQPSELVKLTLSLYVAKLASKEKKFLSYLLPIAAVSGLIMLQPDLGTTVVVIATSFAQIFIAGVSLIYFLGASLVGLLLGLLMIAISDYRRERLMTFLTESADPLGGNYHIRQALLALGAGGLFGVGLGQSRQKYLFLPEAASDSIFAIIAEETGFLGAALLIGLFALFIFRGLSVVLFAPDTFSRICALGIVSWIGFQIFFNIGSQVVLTPLTGVPLPFFSYGGSSLVTVLTGTGILLNISRYAKKEKH